MMGVLRLSDSMLYLIKPIMLKYMFERNPISVILGSTQRFISQRKSIAIEMLK